MGNLNLFYTKQERDQAVAEYYDWHEVLSVLGTVPIDAKERQRLMRMSGDTMSFDLDVMKRLAYKHGIIDCEHVYGSSIVHAYDKDEPYTYESCKECSAKLS